MSGPGRMLETMPPIAFLICSHTCDRGLRARLHLYKEGNSAKGDRRVTSPLTPEPDDGPLVKQSRLRRRRLNRGIDAKVVGGLSPHEGDLVVDALFLVRSAPQNGLLGLVGAYLTPAAP
jgi:hypothetical protein